MEFIFNDGGRADAGRKGMAGDCVVRSIAIATGLTEKLERPGHAYAMIYADLFEAGREFAKGRSRAAKHARRHGASPRNRVHKPVIQKYLESIGWTWVPTMFVGQGCKVHLDSDELPAGRLIVSVSKHVTCVIDGVLHDTHECTRGGTRCVYGYWHQE